MNNLQMPIPQFVSVSDLQRNYVKLLSNLNYSQKPLLILKKNKLEAVMLLPDLYKDLIEKARLYEEELALDAIKTYKNEKIEGRLKKMKKISELFEE